MIFLFCFKMFYPPKGDAQHLSRGPIVFTCDLFGLVNLQGISKILQFSRAFFCTKMFYPPKGDAQHLTMGSICFYLCFILWQCLGLVNLQSISKIYKVSQTFFCFKMFYPPKGDTLYLTMGSICFYLCFILGQ